MFGTAPYTGKTLGELASEFNIPFEEVLINLGPKGASAAYFIMDETLQSRLLVSPSISISSDGSPQAFHPRGHGTFAKIIEKYVNQQGLLSLTEAIRKMTSQSAKILGISDRGVIKVGNKADIIIFDLSQVKANANYAHPHRLAEGFSWVIVNGKIARSGAIMEKNYYGKVLQPD
ncbi:MAG: amidohydrolase family protein [Enterobacterales bacterium]|nr:amidohydrolase family protein [Enterobacterales bacterium]